MTLHFPSCPNRGVYNSQASIVMDYDSHCNCSRSFKRLSYLNSLLTIGIGLGLARHLLRHDPKLTIVATSRTPDKTRDSILAKQEDNLDDKENSLSDRLRVLHLDVTNEATIHSARDQVEQEFGKGSIKC